MIFSRMNDEHGEVNVTALLTSVCSPPAALGSGAGKSRSFGNSGSHRPSKTSWHHVSNIATFVFSTDCGMTNTRSDCRS
jgi:hypothetical protein